MNNLVQSALGVLVLLTWFAAIPYAVVTLAAAWWHGVVLGLWGALAMWRLWQIVVEWNSLRDLMKVFGFDFDQPLAAFYDVEGKEPYDG